ncbi:MAG TPA: hypothetical protein VIU15_15020 [Streptomyces sp.]
MSAAEKDLTEDFCRVCGLEEEGIRNRYGSPSYFICACCGNEAGIGDDDLYQVRQLRGYWVAKGAPWDDSKFRPEQWDLLEQMKNLPPEWR